MQKPCRTGSEPRARRRDISDGLYRGGVVVPADQCGAGGPHSSQQSTHDCGRGRGGECYWWRGDVPPGRRVAGHCGSRRAAGWVWWGCPCCGLWVPRWLQHATPPFNAEINRSHPTTTTTTIKQSRRISKQSQNIPIFPLSALSVVSVIHLLSPTLLSPPLLFPPEVGRHKPHEGVSTPGIPNIPL